MNKLNIQSLYVSLKARKLCKCIESVQYIHYSTTPNRSKFDPNRSKFDSNQILNSLSKSGRIDEAGKLFDEMPEKDEFTWNTIIAAYANSGRLNEAEILFSKTPLKSTITWNSLISGYCKYEFEREAFALFWGMQIEGFRPNQFTLGSVLRMCSKMDLLKKGEQIHSYGVKTQFDSNIFVVTGLVDMYAKCKSIFEAEYLFQNTPDKENHVMWTAMVTGYAQNGDVFKAMECFRDMKAAGVESNQFTFPSILTTCGSVWARKFGAEVHCCLVKTGFEANVYVQSALVDMYAKSGDFESAKMVLMNLEVDDVISWNSMIVGCVRNGFENEAIVLFREMHLKEMKIDEFTIPSILNCFRSKSGLKNPESVHCLVIKTGFVDFKLVNNALVDMYAKRGSLEHAFDVFTSMVDKDVISWTSLITGYTHNGSHEHALKLFRDMRLAAGVYPDEIVTASVLRACGEVTVLEFGKQVHGNFVKSGLSSCLSVDNSLVAMYAKCGCLEDAYDVFNSMRVKDVISWTTLIVGYAKNGSATDSLLFYDKMIESGIKPDFVTFVGLLFACSHAGFTENGRRYFESMSKYGIKPGPEHYACMIDLYGRSGDLVEAEKLLNEMDVDPDATVWKALLSACRVHGNLKLGEKAGKNLMELEPMNAVPYVLLSNMYSAVGNWKEAAGVRRLMKSRGVNKEPGCSWIEVNSKLHSFTSEDRGHSRTVEIYSKVDEMMLLIKKAGYEPDLNFALHDMDEEGKALGLAYHSEKLAVAFGLLVVPVGAPIRVFKNLRVCGDCHNAMKYVSRIYLRHLILRDSNCFHHFKDGRCSCCDYW